MPLPTEEARTRAAAIIIVTYNSRRWLAQLRARLEAQTRQDFRLIVWDNASRDGEQPSLADLPDGATLILHPENIGFAPANNRAAALDDAPFLVLLNPDAFPEPDWLENLLAAAAAQPEAGAIGSTQIAAETPDRYDGLGDCYHAFGLPWRGGFGWSTDHPAEDGAPFSTCAAASLYRREAWAQAGGFDEAFVSYCEDVDLGFRLRLAGWAIRQAPLARVRHVGSASSGRWSRYAVFHGTRNRLWTFVKNMPGWSFWAFLPAHVAVTMLFLAVSPFRGTGAATWEGVGAALGGLPAAWRARARIQRNRKAKTGAVLAAMAWSPLAVLRRAPILRKR